jgi:hypothetical protein
MYVNDLLYMPVIMLVPLVAVASISEASKIEDFCTDS